MRISYSEGFQCSAPWSPQTHDRFAGANEDVHASLDARNPEIHGPPQAQFTWLSGQLPSGRGHIALRSLVWKRSEWEATTRICKLDIRKAHDNAAWRAITALVERRRVPQEHRSAYWRLHLDRALMFRTADGIVTFRAVARRGMPQGSPESPMLYAALVEDLIERAEQRLWVAQRPAGV